MKKTTNNNKQNYADAHFTATQLFGTLAGFSGIIMSVFYAEYQQNFGIAVEQVASLKNIPEMTMEANNTLLLIEGLMKTANHANTNATIWLCVSIAFVLLSFIFLYKGYTAKNNYS